jgi:hypothetical protein
MKSRVEGGRGETRSACAAYGGGAQILPCLDASPFRPVTTPEGRPGLEGAMELKLIGISKPDEANLILGQAHFIKTVEDLYETLVQAVPGIRFGLAFCESSGPCLVRAEGTDPDLKQLAVSNAQAIGAGHAFVVLLRDAYPVNVLNAVKACPEVCRVYCATANPVQVVVAESEQGRGILGVIDGSPPSGVEDELAAQARHDLLRRIGYKR